MPKLLAVTGGTGGLGRAVVEELLARGFRVVVGDRGGPRPGSAVAGAEYAKVDAADEASVAAFFGALKQPFGLVNLVGGYSAGPTVAELELSQLRQQLELNLVTAALLTKWALKTIPGPGRIVHVSSRAARESGANAFAYSAAKLAVIRLVEAAAAENRDRGVTVNCVLPSIIDTPPNRAALPKADFDRWPKPAQIAKVLAFLVSDDAELVSGAALPVYGRA